jgi:beta-lactam-binding protein with PASTA domain
MVLRILGRLLTLAVCAGLFVVSAYLAFSLFVQRGVTAVPDLGTLDEASARGILADQGLVLARRDDPVYDPAVPAGHVAQQDPAAGSLVKRGSTVTVVVSGGPRRIEVPDLRGSALPAAQVTLVAAGLAVGRTSGVYRAGAVPGTVVEQDPRPGSRTDTTGVVNVLYALEGSEATYVMPDLVYRRYEDVRQFFANRGFRLGSVKYEPYEGIVGGVVLRQYPLAGHPLRRQDPISLVVAAQAAELPFEEAP